MATDQEIRDGGILYMPKQKYLQNPYNLPIAPVPPTTPGGGGITNTNAFNNGSNSFNSTGNAFGYGEAVQRTGNTYADIVARSGKDSPQARKALTKAGGTYNSALGNNFQSNEGGLEYFPGGQYDPNVNKNFKEENEEEKKKNFLSKIMSSGKKKMSGVPDWMKNTAGTVAASMFLPPQLSVPLGLLKQFGGESKGPTYGIAGLSDSQKSMYDDLASKGFLFDGPNGIKTFDGKNFSRIDQNSVDKYFDSKIGITRGGKKMKNIEDYKNYIKDKPNLLKTFQQYELLQDNLGKTAANEKVRADQIQKIKNQAISRKIRSGPAKNNPFSDDYSGKKGSPNYTPQGPNENTGPATTTNNDNGGGGGGTNNSQHGSSGMTKSQHSAFRMAKGGRAGYFFGGRVNYKVGGRTDAGPNRTTASHSTRGQINESGEKVSGGQTTRDNNNNNGGDNPSNFFVEDNPVDISAVTKSLGDYEIPYGVQALMANKGKFQAVLNADNVLNKNLGVDVRYDNGPFSVDAYAGTDGNKFINANYTGGSGSKYSFGLNDEGGQFKFARTFANGGLADLL